MNLSQRILSSFPDDKILGIAEVCDCIRMAAPGRTYKRESVRAVLFRLYKEGALRRIQAGHGSAHVRYCLPACDVPPDPRAIRDWAALVMRDAERELSPTEIMIRMIDLGYEPKVAPSEAVKHLQWVLHGKAVPNDGRSPTKKRTTGRRQ